MHEDTGAFPGIPEEGVPFCPPGTACPLEIKKGARNGTRGKGLPSSFLFIFFYNKKGAISGTLFFLPSLMRKEVHHPVAAGPFLPRQIPVPQ